MRMHVVWCLLMYVLGLCLCLCLRQQAAAASEIWHLLHAMSARLFKQPDLSSG